MLLEVLAQAVNAGRFRWYGAAAAWLVGVTGWSWVALQPNVYEASARVYVDTSSVLRPLLNNQIVPSDVASRLVYVRQALLGSDRLEQVAIEHGLDLAAVTQADRQGMIQRLSANVKIAASSADQNTRDPIFAISFRHTNRETAVGVVQSLLDLLIEDTLSANRRGTDTAERFLDERIREYENRLQQAERSLAEFQKANSGRLPGSEGGYFERIQRERDALQETHRNLRLAESKRNQLREQLSGEVPLMLDEAVATREPPPNSIDARIRDARTNLDRLLLQYTDVHPDVIAVRESLTRLEAQRTDQLRSLGVTDADQQLSTLGANPVYQAVQIALNDAEVEVSTLAADAADRQRRLNELQALIDEVPEVEAELARLNRDYDVIRDQYQVLIQSRETQTLSRQASDTDQVEFRILNPPQAGFNPVAPARLMLVGAVLVAALGSGGTLCYIIAQLKPVFSTSRSLREASGLPVLGIVSHVLVDAAGRRQRHVGIISFSIAIGGLFGLFAFVLWYEVMGPGLKSLLDAT